MNITRTCSVDGCERGGEIVRGLCQRHYDRARRSNKIAPLPRLTVAEKLSAGLERKPNGCLEWVKGVRNGGYGEILANGTMTSTHRLAWKLANGPIPDGLCVLHHCDNKPCCETEPSAEFPDGHLFLGTKADNTADMYAKGRQGSNGQSLKTHCPQNHPYDVANTYVDRTGRRHCRTCRREANIVRSRRRSLLRKAA